MEEQVKLDKRVIKTKKAIRQAFARLLSEKELNMITIKDISDGAEINRKTFHNHYAGVYQLLEEIENEITAALLDSFKDVDFKTNYQNPYEIFTRLTTIINNEPDFYAQLLRMEHNANLNTKIINILVDELRQAFRDGTDLEEVDMDTILLYTTSGIMAVYRNWYNSNREESLEEVAEKVNHITSSIIQGA